MKNWYGIRFGKRTAAAGLTAMIVLTGLLTVCIYQTENEKQGEEQLAQQTEESSMSAAETDQLAEDMGHELPIGYQAGELQLVQEQTQSEEMSAAQEHQESEETQVAPAADQLHITAGNLNYDGTARLQWPVAGRKLLQEFSMDHLVYYATLKEYKVSPAILIQANPGDAVIAPWDGIVSEIGANEEIGNYICMKLSDSYDVLIGNMSTINVSVGQYLVKGTLLGGVAAPTKYYVTEGPNVYFQVKKDTQPVDPLDYLD